MPSEAIREWRELPASLLADILALREYRLLKQRLEQGEDIGGSTLGQTIRENQVMVSKESIERQLEPDNEDESWLL